MGKILSEMASKEAQVQIVAGIDKVETDKVETDRMSYPVYLTLEQCQEAGDVVVDFSNASAVTGLADWCAEKYLPLVLCTTGMNEKQMAHLKKRSEQIPIVCAVNLSPGINIIMKMLKQFGTVLWETGYDIEVIEKHHKTKVDIPSGTALALAETLGQKKEIPILAFRGGSIVGEHEIICAGADEVLEIKHVAYSRNIFGKGALMAAMKIIEKPAGFYELSDLFSLD